MLERIDESFLGLAEIVVRKFNWFTGKDNVWLAMIVNVVAAGVGGYAAYDTSDIFLYSVVVIFFILNSFVVLYTAYLYGKDIKGTSIERFSNKMRSSRLMMLALLVFGWAVFVLIDNFEPGLVSPLLPVYCFLLPWVLYIIGVSRPPFEESKAIEEFEEVLSQEVREPAKANK